MLQIFLTLEKQMRPKEMKQTPINDLFRQRLENIIDMRHELVKLSEIIDWSSLNEEFGTLYSDVTGRVGKPIRLMAGILLLQHTYKLSDEEVAQINLFQSAFYLDYLLFFL